MWAICNRVKEGEENNYDMKDNSTYEPEEDFNLQQNGFIVSEY